MTGSPRLHRHARRLLAQLQARTLAREDLRLAAHLDDPAARLALGPEAPAKVKDTETWAVGLAAWGRPAVLRAWAAIAREHLEREGKASPGGRQPAFRTLSLVEAWLRAPGDAGAREAGLAARDLSFGHSGVPVMGRGFYKYAKDTNSMELTHYLGLAVADPDTWLVIPIRGVQHEELPGETIYGPPWDLFRGAARASVNTIGSRATRLAVRKALVPWALGYHDPLDE